ncbi:hypothetical protein PHMEG_00022213, partial [Phytophthora megakarya]
LMFQALQSKIHHAVSLSLPLACSAPPRLEECDVMAVVTPAASAIRSSTRFTWDPVDSTGWSRTSNNGTSGVSEMAAWAGVSGRASAIASNGQVSNSVPGKRENPCSSDVFIRMKRTKSTLPESMDTLVLRRSARSEALSNKCNRRHNSAASW